MTMNKTDLNLVPENIKNLAWRASPQNPHTNYNEKMMARSQLDAVIQYINSNLIATKFTKPS